MARHHHKPVTPGEGFFDQIVGGEDPALVSEAGDRAAAVLVRGARASADPDVTERVLHLAETEGIETIAEIWAGSPAESLAGSLWRLFLLRSWVHADPDAVAREYDAGRRHAQVARVVAGVADPPGPDEIREMVDQVLRGIVGSDFADVLLRAAAFSRVVAIGRSHLPQPADPADPAGVESARRMLQLSEQLEAAGHAELRGELG